MALSLKIDRDIFPQYAAEVMVYFERHKLLEITARILAEISLERPSDPQLWIAKNIRSIADNIYKKCLLKAYKVNVHDFDVPNLTGKFLYRICIYGRHGSGRKSQAIALAKRFNLIYVNAENLIYKGLNGTTDDCVELQAAFEKDCALGKSKALLKLLQRRFTQLDTLRQGWVLVNYPHSLFDIQELFERFIIPPNKFVYLKCPELLAMRRLCAQPNLGRPQDCFEFFKEEMIYFEENKEAIDEYLLKRFETIEIDSTPCYEVVKTNVLAEVERQPYVLGFKN